MPIPQVYRKSNPIIITYSFTDILSGTGTIIFYGVGEYNNSGVTYLLSEQQIYSDPLITTMSNNGTTTLNFDSTINISKTLKGLAHFNIPVGCGSASGTNNAFIYATVNLICVRNGTASTIATATTNTLANVGTAGAGSINTYEMFNLKMDVPNYVLQPGDTLRVAISLIRSGGAANGIYAIGHDPYGRTGVTSYLFDDTKVPPILKFYIPFKLDL